MNKDYLMALAQDATNDAELSSRDIPAIDLYVDQIINLINMGGFSNGVGEWRPEKDGQFGTFHVALDGE